jgi:hypothetical protein
VTVDGAGAAAGGRRGCGDPAAGVISAEVLKGLRINKLPKGTDSAAIGRELVKRKRWVRKLAAG